jgi:hypothetical protein
VLPLAALVLGTMVSPANLEAPERVGAGLAEPLVSIAEERAPHLLPPLREKNKKELWLREKAVRPDARVSDQELQPARPARPGRKPAGRPAEQAEHVLASAPPAVGTRIEPLVTLHNQWTRELLPLIPGLGTIKEFRFFLRDHFTNQATEMDPRLRGVLAAAALRFRAQRIDVISGYRSPKYNLMLRKKGHQVARESQHVQGTAVDFRVRGVPIETLLGFVRSLHLGGVGFYPHSRFVHSDTGRVRFWKGS